MMTSSLAATGAAPDAAHSPLDAADLRARVQARVDATLADQSGVLRIVSPDVLTLVDAIAALLSGGKRLRAACAYWGYRAAGGADSEGIIAVATSMEFFQAAALLHDDVMDESDTRRGQPAAHRQLAARHTAQGWSGDSRRFGSAGAILAGNLCLTWTDSLYATSGLSTVELDRGRPLFDVMRTQLMGGQYLDVLEAARGWAGLSTTQRRQRSREVIRFKSAKYTVEHPLLIGAMAAGASGPDLEHLSAYGLALGEAFQLRDDLLGVFGDPSTTGKPAGDDLREGKLTMLVAEALDTASDVERATVTTLLGRADVSMAQIHDLREILRSTGAVDRVEALIEAGAHQANDALDAVTGLDAEAVSVLRRLVTAATERTA